VIEARDLVKSFDGKEVLHHLDLEVKDHRTLVILGPSGQGKTVLIKSLAGLVTPDSGTIFYDGLDILRIGRKQFQEIKKKMAFVFQANALFDFLNVRDNLSLSLTMHSDLSEREIRERVEEGICFVGLDNSVLEKFPEELSGGMSKRVAIARAMIIRPSIIFYDEPTTGLDEGNKAKVMELIGLLKKEVCATSVVVSHDVQLMFDVSDRVAFLKQGRITFYGRKGEVTEAMLRDLYAGGENNHVA